VISLELEPAREVHLPDALGRQFREKIGHRLATVELTRPDVVQIQQNAIVGTGGRSQCSRSDQRVSRLPEIRNIRRCTYTDRR
jgi:hypothetical protein